mmetsp:Transcript_13214/g.42903  ORF Transcript_13214/g.42903 Transcript_13214/m.42903 type:complete len:234 (-) Transcript_13214:26-727(-)
MVPQQRNLDGELRSRHHLLRLAKRLEAQLWAAEALPLEDLRHQHLRLELVGRPELVRDERRGARDREDGVHPPVLRQVHLRLHEQFGRQLHRDRGVLRGRSVQIRVLLLQRRPLPVDLPQHRDGVVARGAARFVHPVHVNLLRTHRLLQLADLGRHVRRDDPAHARRGRQREQHFVDRDRPVRVLWKRLERLAHVSHVLHRLLHMVLRGHLHARREVLGHLREVHPESTGTAS